MSKATDQEVAAYTRRVDRLTGMFLRGERDQAYVLQGLQELSDGKYTLVDPFGRYDHLLHSLAEQQELLRRFDRDYWSGRFEAAIKGLDIDSDHVQRVTDIEHFHVAGDSLADTVKNVWWPVLVGEAKRHFGDGQPHSWWDQLVLNDEHLRLIEGNRLDYTDGIHRVRTNPVAHWVPEGGRTLEEVREQAKATGEVMAGPEVMSLWGEHFELLLEQDGENLPYTDMPATDVTVPGGSRPHALYVSWGPFSREVSLSASWVSVRSIRWAAPVLVGVAAQAA